MAQQSSILASLAELNRASGEVRDDEATQVPCVKTGRQLNVSLRLMIISVGMVLAGLHFIHDGMLLGADQRNTTYSQGTGANTSMRILYDDSHPVVKGVVIVKFKEPMVIPPGLSKTGVSSLDQLLGEQGVYSIDQAFPLPAQLLGGNGRDLQRIYYVRFNSGAHPREVALRISQDPDVVYAVPQYVYRINQSSETRPAPIGNRSFATPNDSLFSVMNHLSQVRVPAAWNVTKGEDGGVIIAVVDGGTDWLHEDLQANVWINPGEVADNNIDDDHNGYVDDVRGWNFVKENGDPTGLIGTPLNANHGTAVAGIASAVTNNSIGIAGASWNAQLLLVNASCASDSLICYGVEGIVYAAVNGADIINLSWGGSHPNLNSFEDRALIEFWGDIADFAAERGALLVAAAGNSNLLNDVAIHYPASAEHILSVGATNKSNDTKTSFSNYGLTVDVFAPGSLLNSTIPDNSYTEFASGTSFSSPLVAGIAALVKTQFPDLTPDQLAQQLRVTAHPIDDVNTGRTDLMGKGRIDALGAVSAISTPAIRIAGISFTDSGADGLIDNGETVDVTVSLVNYLADATNIVLTLIQEDPNITITSSEDIISSLLMSDTTDAAFQFTVGQAESGQSLSFVIEISASGYQDRALFRLYANVPPVVTHNTGPLQVSLTAEGNIGWTGLAAESAGAGFVYNQTNLLFEGGLLVAVSRDEVSDCIRGTDEVLEKDFQMPPGEQLVLGPGQIANEEGTVMLVDDLATSPIGLLIQQESFADNNPDFDDFVIFKYTITNKSGGALRNLYAGLFFDWDLSENGQQDYGRFDAARRMGIVQNSESTPSFLAATKMLTENGDLSYRTIDNEEIYGGTEAGRDGFTATEKWQFLRGGIQTQNVNSTDVSTLMAAGPFVMGPDQTIEVAFAVVAGTTREDLDIHADSAQAFWDRVIPQPQANHVPVFTSVLPTTTIFAGEDFTYTYQAEDADGDDLTFALVDAPPAAVIDSETGIFTFHPTYDDVGQHLVAVIVSDSISSALSTVSLSVEVGLFSMSQNFSNPFKLSTTTPTTTIEYQLAEEEKIELVVYDLMGREVRTLVNTTKPPGKYLVAWDARDNYGRTVSAGIYLYRIRAGDFIKIRKMMLLK